jgi:hypothetical protein
MEGKEIKQKFEALYNTMATSNEPKYMSIFGETIKAMLDDMIAVKPELAREYVEKLEAIEWNNYLTKKEAMEIVEGMSPSSNWSADAWLDCMEKAELCMEEKPYYNDYALFVAMNQVISDHGNTLALVMGKESESEVEPNELIRIAYKMAIDLLKDKDNRYNIRRYFLF